MRRTTQTPLRNLRRTRTINQETLARLAGVSQKTISLAERGLIQLTPDLQARIAAILGTTKRELFPESEAVAS